MARTRNLEVVISGDTRQLNRAFGQAEQGAGKLQTRFTAVGRAGALAGTAIAGALVVGLTKATQAAVEAEKSQARMQAQLKASGINYRAHAKEIDNVIQRTAKLAAVDDEDLQDAFTNIVRSTGSVSKSLHLTGLAADIAAAKHISLEKAGTLVGKVATGNVSALSRYGITIDKGASSTEALGKLQEKFKGQAEAYGKTTAGSMDRARNSLENLGEAVGAKTAPLLAKGAEAFTGIITGSSRAGQRVRQFASTIRTSFENARQAVSNFVRRNRAEFDAVINAVQAVGRFFRNVFNNIIVPTVRAALPGIKQAIDGIVQIVRGLVRIVTGILTGDWKRVWSGLKDVVGGAIRGLAGVIKAEGSAIGTAVLNVGKGLGRAIVRGIMSAFSGIGGAIKDKLSGAVGALNPFGDGLGRKLGDGIGIPSPGSLAPLPTGRSGGSSASLQGADSALSPFARAGLPFGLHVSSGKRAAGGRTVSGGISYHGSGEAIDMSNGRGPDPQKLAYFRAMKSRFGSRLAELIYTPGGAGIKDGRPFQYTGAVAADHFDHVHVALDLGRPGPGIGDGPGHLSGAMLAADAAYKAGFRGESLVDMVAIAGRESSYVATAHNPVPPDDSWGFWQINVRPEANPRFKSWNLIDPYVNARAARILFKGAGLHPWNHKGGPLGATNVPAARRAVQAYLAGGARGSGSTSAGAGSSSGSSGGGSAAPERVSSYDMAIAGSDVAVAEAQQGGIRRGPGGRIVSSPALRETSAQRNRLGIVNARIRKVRAALKRHLTPATRLRLKQELASLYGERSTIAGRIDELGKLPEAEAGDAPSAADYAQAQIALAELTPDTTDDVAALTGLQGIRQGELASAMASGDPRKVAEAAGNLKAVNDSLNSLQQTIEDEKKAREEHTQALKDVAAELKRQTDFATSVQSTESFQLKKYLADLLSGQVAGAGVVRGYTPGTGVAHAY